LREFPKVKLFIISSSLHFFGGVVHSFIALTHFKICHYDMQRPFRL